MSLAAPIEGRAFAIGVAVVALAAFGLTRGRGADADSGATLSAFAGDAVVETFAPDRVALQNPGLTFRPPWFVGAPEATAVVTRGEQPRPNSLFAEAQEDGAWTRWAVDNDGANQAEPERGRAATTYDFLPALGSARVSIVNGEGVERVCDGWLFGRWYCGPDSWNYVGSTPLMVRNRETQCIWAHPTVEGTLRIAYEDVPVGRIIAGRHMLSDTAAESGIDGGVELVIRIDGQEVARKRQSPRAGASSFRVRMAEEVRRIASGEAPLDVDDLVEGSGDTPDGSGDDTHVEAPTRVPTVARGQGEAPDADPAGSGQIADSEDDELAEGSADAEEDGDDDGSGDEGSDDAPAFADVVFEVRADEVGLQHFCFAAEVRHIPTGR